MLADFYFNPFTFVGDRNKCFSLIQILIFRVLRNSADGHISSLGYLCTKSLTGACDMMTVETTNRNYLNLTDHR